MKTLCLENTTLPVSKSRMNFCMSVLLILCASYYTTDKKQSMAFLRSSNDYIVSRLHLLPIYVHIRIIMCVLQS